MAAFVLFNGAVSWVLFCTAIAQNTVGGWATAVGMQAGLFAADGMVLMLIAAINDCDDDEP